MDEQEQILRALEGYTQMPGNGLGNATEMPIPQPAEIEQRTGTQFADKALFDAIDQKNQQNQQQKLDALFQEISKQTPQYRGQQGLQNLAFLKNAYGNATTDAERNQLHATANALRQQMTNEGYNPEQLGATGTLGDVLKAFQNYQPTNGDIVFKNNQDWAKQRHDAGARTPIGDLNNQGTQIKQILIKAKQAYDGADAMAQATGADPNAIRQAAMQDAANARELAGRLGIDVDAYNEYMTTAESQNRLQNEQAQALRDAISGKYGKNADEYYNDIYQQRIAAGDSVPMARRIARNMAGEYQANRRQYLNEVFNGFGVDADGATNRTGSQILTQMREDYPELAQMITAQYPSQKELFQVRQAQAAQARAQQHDLQKMAQNQQFQENQQARAQQHAWNMAGYNAALQLQNKLAELEQSHAYQAAQPMEKAMAQYKLFTAFGMDDQQARAAVINNLMNGGKGGASKGGKAGSDIDPRIEKEFNMHKTMAKQLQDQMQALSEDKTPEGKQKLQALQAEYQEHVDRMGELSEMMKAKPEPVTFDMPQPDAQGNRWVNKAQMQKMREFALKQGWSVAEFDKWCGENKVYMANE